jgi:hypothetical protein
MEKQIAPKAPTGEASKTVDKAAARVTKKKVHAKKVHAKKVHAKKVHAKKVHG